MPLQSSALPTQLSKGADEYISIFGSNVPLSNVPMCEIKVRSLPWVKTGSCFGFFLEHFQCLISSRSSCSASYYMMDPFPAGSFQNRTDLCKESISFTEKRLFCCYPPNHLCIFTSWPAASSSMADTEFAIPHHRLYSAGDTYFLNINWQLTKTS